MTTQNTTCPHCGKPVSEELLGLCPECMLKAGLGTVAGGEAAGSAATTGFVPPTPEELSGYFPQLEITELLGRGGMGAVYKARQKSLDRVVALKILPPGVGEDPAFAERFTREARALAQLSHPHIVTLYEFGQVDGLFCFLMEFVDGVNLRQVMDVGRLAPKEALAIVPQICDALQFAHDRGIVNRDIKPENILLRTDGAVKIADFGVAKIIGREPTRIAAAEAQLGGLTQARGVLGTPQYMAPEQGEHPLEVDHRADIYSLGVVFYEMLTGELPAKRIEPPSRKVQIDVRLDEVVLRAMEREPGRRYARVSELKTQVETIVQTEPAAAAATAAPHASDWRRRIVLVGVRDGQRVINWPAVVQSAMAVALISSAGFLITAQFLGLGGRDFLPMLLLVAVISAVATISGGIYRAFHIPIDRLVPLDQQAQKPPETGQARRFTDRVMWAFVGFVVLMILLSYGNDHYRQRQVDILDRQVAVLQGRQAENTTTTATASATQKTVQLVIGKGRATFDGREIPTMEQAYFSLAKLPDPAHTVLVCDLRNTDLPKRDVDVLVATLLAWKKEIGLAEVQYVEPTFPAASSRPAPIQAQVKSAAEVVPDRAASRPQATHITTPVPTPQAASPSPSFGPVIERVISNSGKDLKDCFLDADSGRVLSAPKELIDSLKPEGQLGIGSFSGASTAVDWARTNGVDFMKHSGEARLAMLEGYTILSAVPFERQKADGVVRLADHLFETAVSLNPPGFISACDLPPDPSARCWVFRTREGGRGVLEFVGFTGKPGGVKIRYKLVQVPTTASSSVTAPQ